MYRSRDANRSARWRGRNMVTRLYGVTRPSTRTYDDIFVIQRTYTHGKASSCRHVARRMKTSQSHADGAEHEERSAADLVKAGAHCDGEQGAPCPVSTRNDARRGRSLETASARTSSEARLQHFNLVMALTSSPMNVSSFRLSTFATEQNECALHCGPLKSKSHPTHRPKRGIRVRNAS